jgi:predicted nucleic acid-binding protein
MILPDTSIWIAAIRDEISLPRSTYGDLCTCGPVIQEVLQGLGDNQLDQEFRIAISNVTTFGDPLPVAAFKTAAAIYHQGRARGYTIRSSFDCLIAAIAIDYGLTVWHRDRDYDAIAKFTPLRVTRTLRNN